MEYTKNYKLPQWEETDRIEMKHFNQMNLDIDAALKMAQDTADGVMQVAAFRLEEEMAALGEELVQTPNRLLNPLTSAEMAETLEEGEWDAEKGVYIGYGPIVGRDFLQSYSTNFTRMVTDKTYNADRATALYEFTSPLSGVIVDFDLQYYMFYGTDSNQLIGSMTLTAEELQGETYTVVYTQPNIPLELSGTSITKESVTISTVIPLRKGFSYRIVLHLDSGGGVMGNLGFTSTNDADDSAFSFRSRCVTIGSHTQTLTTRGKVNRAVILLRCWQETGTGGVEASIDGIPLQRVGCTANGENAAEQDILFFGGGTYTGNPSLTITMHCDETDRMGLTKYGVLLM